MNAPTSTYRLQIRDSLTLDEAADLLDHLIMLGAGAVYLSPILTSTRGSDHGYDVTDPSSIDPQRGGEAGWRRLLTAARRAGLPVVVDIVPNHLGIEHPEQNPAWWDVLSHGRDSAYAGWFDIAWGEQDSPEKVLLPVLGEGPDELDRLRIEDGRLCYWEHRFPIAPGTGDGTPQQVHDRQHYRLVSFRRANTELGYRRFFAVNTLAGVRVEDPAVFAATHARIATMISEGVAGVRVDHPDGLADPAGYLERLRALAPEAWITVEKILEPGEQLPAWPVAGTTGYDALTGFGGVFVDPAAEPVMTEIYQRLTGDHDDIEQHILTGKQMVLDTLFGSELRRLSRLVPDLPEARQVLREAAARFTVYRSYLPEGADRTRTALGQVRTDRPELADTIDALLPRLTDPSQELAVRFQQLTGAVMAKGVEDTAFYRYNRLIALNEVGGDPGSFGTAPMDFHAAQQARSQHWPQTMTTLSTHDTKRSEDVRATIAVLAEVPQEWEVLCSRLFEAVPLPEPTMAYLLWQTVAGVGLIEPERLHGYAEKAMREAALATTWTDPDEAFEETVHAAVDQLYASADLRRLIEDFRARIAPAARSNILGQKLVQLTAPGVPDVYQGTEFTDDSLVDPDNRRPVDFSLRRRELAALDADGPPPAPNTTAVGTTAVGTTATETSPTSAAGSPDTTTGEDFDLVKLWVTSRALRARRELADRLTGYRPVVADGPAAAHLIGFDRGPMITLATRLPVGLAGRGGWRDTTVTLPHGRWLDRLSGRTHSATVRLDAVLDRYPVALLTASDD